MDFAVLRRQAEEGGWFRPPEPVFRLTACVSFSREEQWLIHACNLQRHVILDRTPAWYPAALRDALRQKERAAKAGEHSDWPAYLPAAIPEEWVVTVGRVLREPAYTITFRSARELALFEPKLVGAFAGFKHFLLTYASRPAILQWRF